MFPNMFLHYEFPVIEHIDAVLPHIEGREEFKVYDRDHGIKVIDYAITLPDSFPSIEEGMADSELRKAIIRRECRGLIFSKEGNIVARRLSKFFNIGEREETQTKSLDFSMPHHLLDKEDGSMVSPITGESGNLFWGTMRGETSVARNCSAFIEASPLRYEAFSRYCIDLGLTPIFEWCDPRVKIVIQHREPKMVLLSIRRNVEGTYLTYEEAVEMAGEFKIPVVRSFGLVKDSPAAFLERVREETAIEGYVIQFETGHRVKMKTEWYCDIHRTKDSIRHEKDIWKLVLNNGIDDLIPFLDGEDTDRILKFQENFLFAIRDTKRFIIEKTASLAARAGADRKAFAYSVNTDPMIAKSLRAVAFRLYDTDRNNWESKADEMVRYIAMDSTRSGTYVENTRKFIKVEPWDSMF